MSATSATSARSSSATRTAASTSRRPRAAPWSGRRRRCASEVTRICSLAELAAAIPDGAKLAIPAHYAGPAMAATRELVRRGACGLHLVCVPQSGVQADVLIGAGAVRAVETSAVPLGESGPAPRFTAAVREGGVRVLDATCPAIHAALQAAQKGLPFMPLRGILGSDLLAQRPDWKVIANPFAPGDEIVVLP